MRRRGEAHSLRAAVLALFYGALVSGGAVEAPSSPVGIEGRLEALLIGSELVAKPAEPNAPLTVRIESTRARGPVLRYDFRYLGFVPGEYDLRKFLARQDGSRDEFLPPITVQVAGALPTKFNGWLTPHQVMPPVLKESYKWFIGGAAAIWGLVGLPICFAGRRRREKTQLRAIESDDEPLKSLLAGAASNELDAGQKLELERLLIRHWRERLGIAELEVPEALAHLRDHPEAGVLLRALEDWLYRRPAETPTKLGAVLQPYARLQNAPARRRASKRPARAVLSLPER